MHSGKLPNWLPAIFFSFSKRECEEYARQCYKNDKGCAGLCFTTQEEQESIDQVFDNAIQCLNEGDRDLRAVTELRFMLKAGVGVHHGGLLPLMKEVVELLFQEGFIKLLFTTETFAMGLNMPAKTVLFTSLTKWDGSESRYVTSGEYIQMSGRAGRRNKDSHGNVVVLADKTLNEEVAKGLMMGAPSPLVSSFKLSYYTLLNLMKRPEVGTKDLELVIANSFQQFQRDRAAPKLREELTKLEEQIATIDAGAQSAINEYRELMSKMAGAKEVVRAAVMRPDRVMAFLRPGRLVRVAEGKTDWGWGVVVNVIRRPPQGKASRPHADPTASGTDSVATTAASAAQDPPSYYIVDTLLACEPGSVEAKAARPAAPGGPAVTEVLPVSLNLVQELSTLRVALPADLRPPEARQGVLASLRDVARRYPDGLPLLDPIEDVGITDDAGLRGAVAEAADAQARLANNEVFRSEKDKTRFEAFAAQAALMQRAAKIRAELKGSALEKFRDEVTHRTAVMKKLGFLNQEGILTQKGLAAALIDTTDELLSAELMFNGVFKNLNAPQLAALVSCLVFCEKTNDEINLVNSVAEPLAHLQSAARTIAAVSNECKVEVEEEAYVESFRPTLMDVTYRWAQGAAFAEICDLTELYEGSIIRAIRRLDELLTQLAASAAEVGEVGEGGLQQRFLDAQAAIRRDIVFAASLYL